MQKITISEMRNAIGYVQGCGNQLHEISDEKLMKSDFMQDFGMGNIRLANVVVELERIYNISFPRELFQQVKDGTVGALLEVLNRYIEEKNNAD